MMNPNWLIPCVVFMLAGSLLVVIGAVTRIKADRPGVGAEIIGTGLAMALIGFFVGVILILAGVA